MGKIVTFGELMLRLSPEGHDRFFQNDRLVATFGGSEANVAVALAQFGAEARYVTRLPENPVGEAALRAVRAFGVDTDFIARGGARCGIYFTEKGAGARPGVCVYDRAGSAFQTATTADFDWDAIFDGADRFHFTGITPALGEGALALCREAVAAAKRRGIFVSCDTNYRSKLWSVDRAAAVMRELCRGVDFCFTNPGDAKDLFGIEAGTAGFSLAAPDAAGCTAIAERLAGAYGFGGVALTMRTVLSADHHVWSAMSYDGTARFARTYDLSMIVDRIGGGDCFCAGYLYGLQTDADPQETLEFATAASALEHTVEGDFFRGTAAEVRALMAGRSARVQR